MYRITHLLEVLITLLVGAFPVVAQTMGASGNDIQEPHEVTYCELSRDPAAHNHALVRLTAFVTHGFEDFQVNEPDCPTQNFSVWLMYGGKAESNTVYCCPGESGRETRSEFLTVEGVQIPLVNDPTFQQFIELLRKDLTPLFDRLSLADFFPALRRPLIREHFGAALAIWAVAASS